MHLDTNISFAASDFLILVQGIMQRFLPRHYLVGEFTVEVQRLGMWSASAGWNKYQELRCSESAVLMNLTNAVARHSSYDWSTQRLIISRLKVLAMGNK